MRLLAASLVILALGAVSTQAQQARTAGYTDPKAINDDLDPNLAMGRTLLQSARRIYPEAPKVFDGRSHFSINEGNPQPIDRDVMDWEVAGQKLSPKFAFQTGGRWTLYFDANERLITADRSAGKAPETLEMLTQRYPALKLAHDGQNYAEYEVAIAPCHVLSVVIMKESKRTSSYAHSFTCPTAPKP